MIVAAGNLPEALVRLETLELVARILQRAAVLGTVHPLTETQLAGFGQTPPSPPGPEATSPPPATTLETTRRQQVCDLLRHGDQRNLMSGAHGRFSARVDGDALVVNAPGADLQTLDPADLVRISSTGCGDRDARLHQAIYAAYQQLNAVIQATPASAAAFAVTRSRLDARTSPESWMLLGEVANVPCDLIPDEPDRITRIISPDRPAAILENRGVLVVGRSALEAFDRLEVLEATAEAAITARSIGDPVTLSDAAVGQLTELLAAQRTSRRK